MRKTLPQLLRNILVAFGALAVSSCLSSDASSPTKAGASQAELQRDEQECKALATEKAPQGYNAATQRWEPDAYVVTRAQRQCMQSRGWHFAPGGSG